MDAQGMRIDALETLLANAPADALPKLIYTVPTYSNPCGTLLSQERRAQLASLAARHGVVVVEDDPYGELRFSSTAVEPIHALGARLPSANPVIYLSSLSKTLAPALRVGWMVAPAEVIRRCAIAKQTTDLCTSPIAQLIAAEYLNAGRYPDTVERARREYGARMQAMVDMLQAELGGRIWPIRRKAACSSGPRRRTTWRPARCSGLRGTARAVRARRGLLCGQSQGRHHAAVVCRARRGPDPRRRAQAGRATARSAPASSREASGAAIAAPVSTVQTVSSTCSASRACASLAAASRNAVRRPSSITGW